MEPLPYHRLARASGRYRWWRPLLELAMFCVIGFLALLVVTGPLLAQLGDSNAGAAGLVKLASVLALGLPVTFAAARIAGRRAGTLSSIAGRLRWRWLGICVLASLAFLVVSFGAALGASAAFGVELGPERGDWVGWDAFWPLALAVLAVIPLQATAEEYMFRGMLLQAVGAWVSPAAITIVISSALFGLAHGVHLQALVAITSFGVVAAWLAIRTGGLEAAIAVHVLNNVTHFMLEAATGRGAVWVTEINAHITWPATAIDVASNVIYGALIVRLHARFMAR